MSAVYITPPRFQADKKYIFLWVHFNKEASRDPDNQKTIIYYKSLVGYSIYKIRDISLL